MGRSRFLADTAVLVRRGAAAESPRVEADTPGRGGGIALYRRLNRILVHVATASDFRGNSNGRCDGTAAGAATPADHGGLRN